MKTSAWLKWGVAAMVGYVLANAACSSPERNNGVGGSGGSGSPAGKSVSHTLGALLPHAFSL